MRWPNKQECLSLVPPPLYGQLLVLPTNTTLELKGPGAVLTKFCFITNGPNKLECLSPASLFNQVQCNTSSLLLVSYKNECCEFHTRVVVKLIGSIHILSLVNLLNSTSANHHLKKINKINHKSNFLYLNIQGVAYFLLENARKTFFRVDFK